MSQPNLISELLLEQQSLTAVDRFSRNHENGTIPSQARYYQDLIPLTKPAAGEQYAFHVDLDMCSGCKACVSACHSLNGLDEKETWRDVGLLIGPNPAEPFIQTITTACHHCADPGCLNGCPVMAYDKDKETGIVRHLDDQCIGCQYCTMKCPYDVPKYSARLGIVRKCDMCHSRLAVGEAPACVQACPHEAIKITIVQRELPTIPMLPGAYDSQYTKPTTTYSSSKPFPIGVRPADALSLRLEHAHWPLIIMLVLSQMAVGINVMLAGIGFAMPSILVNSGAILSAFAFLVLNVGLIAAVFHLGRPLGAWRFFLGLRTSWMSREILAFSLFAGASSLTTGLAALFIPQVQSMLPIPKTILAWLPIVTQGSVAGSALLGSLAVFTSVMIYVDTHRLFWRMSLVCIQFFGTTILLGTTATSMLLAWTGEERWALLFLAVSLAWIVAMSFARELYLRATLRDINSPDHLSARTISEFSPWWSAVSIILSTLGFAAAIPAFLGLMHIPFWATLTLLFVLSLEIAGRYIFFVAVRAHRMPGGI